MPVAFDNRKRAISYRISSFLLTIGVIIIITLIFFSNLVPEKDALINRRSATITVVVFYLFFGLYRYWLDLHYFYFSDVTNRLIFRFYSLRPFAKLKRSIEIPKDSFFDYTIENDFSGLKPNLVLSQKTLEGIKTYPPIRISALSKRERRNLGKILELHKKGNPDE
ncbi:MAG: hypothetical protein ACOC3T_03385 [Bacteroidota bacterium]